MKKRFVKKYAVLLLVKKNDPNCRCYERAQERHRRYYYKKFRHFIRVAKKRDWWWYYYFQGISPTLGGLSHEEAKKTANDCIADYVRKGGNKYVCR